MDILERVKAIQVERGLTDTQMSTLLGYHNRAGWARIKGGVFSAGKPFQMRAITAFSELTSAVIESQQDSESGGVRGILGKKIVLKVRKFL